MKLAAIDIGSNAIRLQITKVLEYEQKITFKKLQYVRFPLRLGQDVFALKHISEERSEKFMKLMQAYKTLMDLYEIDQYYGCATSAMREAENGKQLAERVRREVGLKINIITGTHEAEMINEVISIGLDKKTYLHIDVGGGSTELNFYYQRKKVRSKSFKIGSVRSIGRHDSPAAWKEMTSWVQDQLRGHHEEVIAIGTGGNINKLYELTPKRKARKLSLDQLKSTQTSLKQLSQEELLNRLQLNPDRADVILPASEIYIHAMKAAGAQLIKVPDVGLKDGINYYLFEKYYPRKGKVFVKND